MLAGPNLLWKQYFVESCEAAANIVPSVGITQEGRKWFRYITFCCSKNIDTWNASVYQSLFNLLFL